MHKRPITYTNLDGKVVTENFYFNLTVDEVAHLELDMPGGLSNYWIKLVEDRDAGKMLHAFKDLIAVSYGEREGEFFMKETESGYSRGRRFLQHPAYHVLFLELLGTSSSDEAFTDFLKAVVPEELSKEMEAGTVKLPETDRTPQVAQNGDPSGMPVERTKPEEYSRQELLEMPQSEFDAMIGTDMKNWSPEVLQVAFLRKGRIQAAPDAVK